VGSTRVLPVMECAPPPVTEIEESLLHEMALSAMRVT
jgi:hypothetical protein